MNTRTVYVQCYTIALHCPSFPDLFQFWLANTRALSLGLWLRVLDEHETECENTRLLCLVLYTLLACSFIIILYMLIHYKSIIARMPWLSAYWLLSHYSSASLLFLLRSLALRLCTWILLVVDLLNTQQLHGLFTCLLVGLNMMLQWSYLYTYPVNHTNFYCCCYILILKHCWQLIFWVILF